MAPAVLSTDCETDSLSYMLFCNRSDVKGENPQTGGVPMGNQQGSKLITNAKSRIVLNTTCEWKWWNTQNERRSNYINVKQQGLDQKKT